MTIYNIQDYTNKYIIILMLIAVICMVFFFSTKNIVWCYIAIISIISMTIYYSYNYRDIHNKFVGLVEESLKMDCVDDNDFNLRKLRSEVQSITMTDGQRLYPVKVIIEEHEEEDVIIFYTPTNVNEIWKKVVSKPIL